MTTFEKVKKQFRKIAQNYEGEITEYPQSLSITARNNIASYYASGKVCKSGNVECTVYVQQLAPIGIVLGGFENTHEILGGFSMPGFAEESLLGALEHYCFKKRNAVQMSIFDL